MKRICTLIILLFSALTMNSESYSQDEFPVLKGPYLGQKPPGLVPELFAPGIVSTENLEIEGVFAPNMNEFFYVRQRDGEKPKTHFMRYVDGVWQKPVEEARAGEIFISTDNKTMFLGNKYKERTVSGWSEEKILGSLYEQIPIMRLTASADQTYVFDEREEIGTIRYSRLLDGKREEPKAFGKNINSGKWTGHPFIAPDESYLIWDSEREGGYGGVDLYISFRQKDRSWGPAINMGGDINSEVDDAYGSVTPDGKYLLFHSVKVGKKGISEWEANIYWVDAQFIENLRPNQ